MNNFSVAIIGGGISGLTCAKYLHDNGSSFVLLESSDAFGGRVRTDKVEGFLLDRGFQILLTNYPEAKKVLNYDDLNLKTFESGALIRKAGGFMKMDNPFKNKRAYLTMAFSSVGTLQDKLKIWKLANEVSKMEDDSFFLQEAEDTALFLQKYGWSNRMIENFFKPFFGGVFLENNLRTSSNFFKFVFKQFFKGEAALPSDGIQAIPNQLVKSLPKESLRLHAAVRGMEGNIIYLENGETISAEKIIIATNPRNADKLLNENVQRKYNMTINTYFMAESSPLKGQKFIALNPNRKGVVHNLCVPSDISSAYGNAGKSLVSVSTHGLEKFDEKQLTDRIRRELFDWFGAQVNVWKHLKTYAIPEALSEYNPLDKAQELKISENVYRCGDYLAYPSLNAAMQTGRKVAEMIVK